MGNNNSGSVIAGSLWMLIISVLLFWLPVAGPLIAGVVGGMKSGGLLGAIMAVFLPAVVVAILIALIPAAWMTGIPVVGAIIASIAAFGLIVVIGLQIGLLLVGAIIGGVIA